MPITYVQWEWQDAFDKFGFSDGDGWNGTHLVADAIKKLGYDVEEDNWGIHNYLIVNIQKDGQSILFDKGRLCWSDEVEARVASRGGWPEDCTSLGYVDPRLFLPLDILEVLDDTFNDAYEVAA